jgi:phosphotransferase system  glucose/maltose/N-acetylglucosamine-specific IIC component
MDMLSTLEKLNAFTVLLVVVRLFTVALLTVLLLAAFYFWNFHGSISVSQDTWGQFGDFIGGALNPIIGLFGLFALLMTLVLQTKELELTREELKRTAISQVKSEQALSKQSETMELSTRLAVLNTLLAHIDKWKERARTANVGPNEYPEYKYWVEERHPVLIAELDSLYKRMYPENMTSQD